MIRKCVHCRKHKANRPRRLCWGCYYRPGVREMYPVASCAYANRGSGLRNWNVMPAHPTVALPGTVEKVAVMAERARRNEWLFHPDDAA